MIPVTKPYLPPKAEFDHYVNGIWERNWLTNNGPLVNELGLNLKKYLKEKHLLFLNNGTIAIQLAIKALNLKGEIITTPFSYVATTSTIVWEGATPVFVDIDKNTLNIDATKIEAAITPNTTGIIATHVYGNPCDVEAIEKIAAKHNLKVIYDAAHAFGVNYKGKSLFGYGDISTTSFHATKLFHTIEGGAVFTQEPDVLKKLSFMRSFGHDGPYDFAEVGINGKNSEFNAAMGLCNLKHIDEIIAKRKLLFERYNAILKPLNARRPQIMEDTEYNYAYYPIVFDTAEQMQRTLAYLNKKEVFPRRYFYPSLAKLSYVDNVTMPITEDIAERVICLPFYYDLSVEEVDYVARLCLRVQNYE